MSSDCDSDDERHFARLPENWIAVFHLRERSGSSVNDLHKECTSMIDRVTNTVVYIYIHVSYLNTRSLKLSRFTIISMIESVKTLQ